MKLVVIILCLLSERYLMHALSYQRFSWFGRYLGLLDKHVPKSGVLANSWMQLAMIVLPLVLLTALVLYLFDHLLFGFVGLLLNILIFYYCLGPENTFYPVSGIQEGESEEEAAGSYLARVNPQLFAVMFWFIIAGPLGGLAYRLFYLCKDQDASKDAARCLTSWLDWVTARLTLLLYLLVGNFQRGYKYFCSMFLASPNRNEQFLSEGGLLAAHTDADEAVSLPYAQNLVEHALVVYLVFLALFTLVAWL